MLLQVFFYCAQQHSSRNMYIFHSSTEFSLSHTHTCINFVQQEVINLVQISVYFYRLSVRLSVYSLPLRFLSFFPSFCVSAIFTKVLLLFCTHVTIWVINYISGFSFFKYSPVLTPARIEKWCFASSQKTVNIYKAHSGLLRHKNRT